MANRSIEDVSKLINDVMDCLGYSEEIIRFRATYYKNLAERQTDLFSQVNQQIDLRFDIIYVGSRAEGVATSNSGSDSDVMCVLRNFLVVDEGEPENDISVIQTDMEGCAPGYTKLISLDMNSDTIGSAILPFTTIYNLDEGRFMLLNSYTRNFHELGFGLCNIIFPKLQAKIWQIRGPSITLSVNDISEGCFPLETELSDNVLAMPYLSSSILNKWKERSRRYQWPSESVVEEISAAEGFVVPVGPIFSQEQDFEWRICYTTAGLRLVSHLSPVQIKLYILLKMIFKQIVNPHCHFITSYMVKNIVFWVCEGNDAAAFTPDKLIPLLQLSLAFLLQCLHSNFLPNYMIPNRNLLLGKGGHWERIKLGKLLKGLLTECDIVIFRLRKIRIMTRVILRNTKLRKVYGKWRDKVEIILFLFSYINVSPAVLFDDNDNVFDSLCESFKNPLTLDLVCALLKLLRIDLLQLCFDPAKCSQQIQNSIYLATY